MKNKYDVAIIGAGPAGSMAGKTIAEKNIDVLIIERNKKIGEPVKCAEGINKFLFEDTGIKKDDSFIRQKINGTKIYFYDEIYELNTEQWKGYTIDRKIFDKYLANQAENNGAKLLKGTKAIGMKKSRKRWIIKIKNGKKISEIEAKIVIGADGFECNVGKWTGLQKKWKINEFAKCLEYEITNAEVLENNRFHILFAEEFPQGYGWVFPKGNNCANVGVGIHPSYNTKNALSFLISKYKIMDKIIKSMSKGEYLISEKRGGFVPVCGPKKYNELIADGVVLIGDSAAIVEPLTAEGIEPSMLSGIAAGEIAVKSILNNRWDKNFLREYDKIWREKPYNGSFLLGETLESGTALRDYFYKVFTDKKISNKEREKLIFNLLK